MTETDLHYIEILLKMLRIFDDEIEVPDLEYHSQECKDQRVQ